MLNKNKNDKFTTYACSIPNGATGMPDEYVSALFVEISEWKIGEKKSYSFLHDTFLYIYSGKLRVAVGEELFFANAGDALILRGGQTWDYFLDEHALCRIMSVNFQGELTNAMLTAYGLKKSAHYPRSACEPLVDMLEIAFQREGNDYLQLENETLRFLLYTFQHLSKNKASGELPIAAAAKQLIMQNLYDPDLQVQQIAKQVNCNMQKLQAYFQEAYGVSMRQFIIRKRLDRVVELLVSSPLSLVEIASLVGYANRNYLDRLFLQYYGVTASAYRKAHRGKKASQ